MVKTTLEKLFSEYVKHEISSSNPSSSQLQHSGGEGTRIMSSSYEEFEEFKSQVSTNTEKYELDTYLDELQMPQLVEIDIFAYWKERSRISPNLKDGLGYIEYSNNNGGIRIWF